MVFSQFVTNLLILLILLIFPYFFLFIYLFLLISTYFNLFLLIFYLFSYLLLLILSMFTYFSTFFYLCLLIQTSSAWFLLTSYKSNKHYSDAWILVLISWIPASKNFVKIVSFPKMPLICWHINKNLHFCAFPCYSLGTMRAYF